MKNWAIINKETSIVENTIVTEDDVTWPSTDTHLAVEFPIEGIAGEWSMMSAHIGWKYLNDTFVEPPHPVPATEHNQPATTGSQTL